LLGWSSLVPLWHMFPLMDTTQLSLLLAGGVSYTVGALIYALQRPDPWPEVFGHHEIWHLFVLLGAGCHFWFNSAILTQAYPPF
jgi:hemolysin III